jgi:DNA polymerase I-like protein with 3'-5' exonuclease and polymerase domains
VEQLPFLPMLPQVDWTLPKLSDLPATWAGARRVCIDFESKDEGLDELGPGTHRPGNYVCGIAIAIEDGPAHYLPIAHEGGNNIEEGPSAAWAYLADRLAEYDGEVVAANAQYELAWIYKQGLKVKARIRDPQVAEPLIWELYRSYKLDAQCDRWDVPRKDEEMLRSAAAVYGYHPKKQLWRLPGRFVAAYGVGDVRRPLSLLEKMERRIEDEDLTEVYDLESRVTPICARMRHRGVRVNIDKVDNIERWARKREGQILAQIREMTGRTVTPEDTWNKGAVKALFDSLGIAVPMSEPKVSTRGKTVKVTPAAPILDKNFFNNCKHPLGQLVIRWREVNKLYTTFCARTRKHAVWHGDHWRVHCTFNQLRKTDDDEREGTGERVGAGTRTGRFSSDNYNLQQELSRSTELVDPEMFPWLNHARVNKKGQPEPWNMAECWKDVYEPDQGKEWCDLDYSQQEPRIEVHFADLANLTGARDAAERWRKDPRMDGHQMVDDMIYELTGVRLGRKTAKNTRLALGYGAGGGKLCETFLHLPTEFKTFDSGPLAGKTIKVAGPEGQKVMDAFKRGAPFVFELAKLAERKANQRGWIRTLLGRVIHFEKWDDGRAKDGHAASNGLCQGGAASQGKKALIDLEDAGLEPQMTCHDAFGLSIGRPEDGDLAHDVMVAAVPLRVPVVVDKKVGPSMGQAA